MGAEQQKARDSHIKGRLVISVRDLKVFYVIVSEESGLLGYNVLSLVSGVRGCEDRQSVYRQESSCSRRMPNSG